MTELNEQEGTPVTLGQMAAQLIRIEALLVTNANALAQIIGKLENRDVAEVRANMVNSTNELSTTLFNHLKQQNT